MANPKTIRVSADVNNRRALDSKRCDNVEDAFNNLLSKIKKYDHTQRGVRVVRFTVGRFNENGECLIAHDLQAQLAELVTREFSTWIDVTATVSAHGLS